MAHKNLLLNVARPSSNTIHYEVIDDDQFYGKLVAYPFEKGYAITVANSLRRVLLSGLPGYAVTGISVKYHDFQGALQMLYSAFDNIYGVLEDTIEIIQNLKKVRLALNEEESEKKIMLEFKGKKTILAKDLSTSMDVHIFNPEQYIATLNEDADFTLEITVNFGRGYVSDEDSPLVSEVGFIPIDSTFSPIEKVTFDISNYRLEQQSGYEQFALEVWTDGSVKVGDAVADASKILKEYYTVFINFNEEEYDRQENLMKESSSSPEEELLLKAMKASIEDLELNARAFNCLQAIGIVYVGDVILKTRGDLEKTKNLGQKSLEEIKHKLSKLNLSVEMDIPSSIAQEYEEFRSSVNEDNAEE